MTHAFGHGVCAALVLLALAVSGCGVGQGSGEANGQLYVLNCSKAGDYCDNSGVCGTAATPAAYKLNPSFFVGEPIDDLTRNMSGTSLPRTNRVTIRVQRSGMQIERNDALFFDIVNSYEVARCVRGREVVEADQTIVHDYDDRYCARASATGPARVRISVLGGYIHSTLSPRMTCTRPVAATADDTFPEDGVVQIESSDVWKSWIEFQDFGSAAQNDRLDPATRDPVSPTFRIELEQRLRASAFSLTLQDEKVTIAQVELRPPPAPDLGGSLTGWFDFDLTRGQGAQIFP
jgi:hypothetical protein